MRCRIPVPGLWAAALMLSAVLIIIPADILPERVVKERKAGPGSTYISIIDAERVLRIHILKVDLCHPDIRVKAVLAQGAFPGRETVLDMVRNHSPREGGVIGGVNGDFFRAGFPAGMMVTQGNLWKTGRGWSSIVFTDTNIPFIAVFSARGVVSTAAGNQVTFAAMNQMVNPKRGILITSAYGDVAWDSSGPEIWMLQAQSHAVPLLAGLDVCLKHKVAGALIPPAGINTWFLLPASGSDPGSQNLLPGASARVQISLEPLGELIHTAISGGPRILRAGRISVEIAQEGQRSEFDTERHPRTAVGYTRDRRFLLLMVVDGRQPGYSRGVSLYELAALMREWRGHDALNLDGGGSSTMVIGDTVVNRPSDITGPRPVANALLVVSRRTQRPAAGEDLVRTERW